MAIRVDSELVHDLEAFGARDAQKCYHCGNCSAVCHHTDETLAFPHSTMRWLQMGLAARLEGSLDPWLCYYCGQCSTQCPREAEPGETMMAMRRWLTARYDVTGLSRLLYRSWRAELLAILLLAVLTGASFLAYGFRHGDIGIYDGPGAFLPSSVVHTFDWFLGGTLSLFLALGAFRMWWLTIGKGARDRVPLKAYLKPLYVLPLHFFTQKSYGRCDRKAPWLIHLGLMLSYVTMLTLIMLFLRPMQAGPEIRWSVHAFGYVASFGLLTTVIVSLRGRLQKALPHLKHSHESDWTFLVLLLLATVTGVAQHVVHRAGADMAANVAYVVHLMVVVPMLALEVPFGKWAHLVYRPLSLYLAEVRRHAGIGRQTRPEEPARVLAA